MKISEKSCCNIVAFKLTPSQKEKVITDMCVTTCRSFTDYARRKLLEKPLTVLYRNQSYDEFTEAYLDFKRDLTIILENGMRSERDQEWLKDRINVLTDTVIKLYDYVRQNRKGDKHSPDARL